MTRVGFAPYLHGEGWLGGLNYFRNLFSALHSLRNPNIEPVLLVRSSDEQSAQLLPSYVPKVKVPDVLNSKSKNWYAKVVCKTPLSWALWRRFLGTCDIEVLSHSEPLLPSRMLPSLGFIYDFQHKHLPQLFSTDERKHRDKAFLSLCRYSSVVLLSSANALSDLATYFPGYATKGRVLRFVANVAETACTPHEILRKKYQLPDAPFIYLPNQFWKHKNHVTVLEALNILKQGKKEVFVVTSGAGMDYRHPEYFPRVVEIVEDLDLQDSFRFLGVIPREDVLGLMRASAAVLNPSLFEGWSTTVEEAKSLGKLVILSSIPVHIEQNPERCLFFDPGSAEQLAHHLVGATTSYTAAAEGKWMEKARAALPERMRAFASAYQGLVHEQLSGKSHALKKATG